MLIRINKVTHPVPFMSSQTSSWPMGIIINTYASLDYVAVQFGFDFRWLTIINDEKTPELTKRIIIVTLVNFRE